MVQEGRWEVKYKYRCSLIASYRRLKSCFSLMLLRREFVLQYRSPVGSLSNINQIRISIIPLIRAMSCQKAGSKQKLHESNIFLSSSINFQQRNYPNSATTLRPLKMECGTFQICEILPAHVKETCLGMWWKVPAVL
jgi:hypothetical protein